MNKGNTDNSWIDKGEALPTNKTQMYAKVLSIAYLSCCFIVTKQCAFKPFNHIACPLYISSFSKQFNTTSRCLACQGMQDVHAAHAAILLLMIAGAIETE